MTGAGVAYAVDTRLRPSGGQGVLVTTFDGFERYQLDRAESWEHIALLRARAIAGHSDAAQRVLDRVRDRVMNDSGECWEYIADLRARVELERATTSSKAISVKTGRGGLMDVDFLAAGGVLETGGAGFPRLPSVPAMLHSLGRGAQIDQLLADYGFLRQIESRARWIAGRATDEARIDQDGLALLADLSNLDLEPEPLLDELTAVRERIRAAFDSVVRARSIAAVTS
jgi:glutamate-ammonia-ligase adenylyltransferase